MTGPPIDAAVSAVAREIGSGVIAVYLFGSVADGRSHRDSDIDLGVLLDRQTYPDSGARFEMRLQLSGRLMAALRRREVDLVVLNDAPPQFARHIVSRGRRLYCADNDHDDAFRRMIMSRAADLEPFLRRARRIKLEALGR